MALFARELALLFDASGCLISTYEATTDAVTDWAAFVIPPAQLNIEAEDYSLNDYPTTRRVLAELIEVSTVIGDGGDPAEHAFLEQSGFQSSMLVPLVMDGRAAGLIELLDTRGRMFTDEDRRALPAVGRPGRDRAGRVAAREPSSIASMWPRWPRWPRRSRPRTPTPAATPTRSPSSRWRSARSWGSRAPELKPIQMGALLHDVGKIGIPEAILNKPGPLTDDEFDVMKRHTVIGADIIAEHPRHGRGGRAGALVARALGRPWLSRRPCRTAGAPRVIRDRRLRCLPRDDRGSGLPQGHVARARLAGAAPLLGHAVHARRGGGDRAGRQTLVCAAACASPKPRKRLPAAA